MKLNRLCEFLKKAEQTFEQYVNYRPTPLNLKSLVEFGQTAPASKSFQFLKHELPVRIANIMQEVRLLPERLLREESVLQIAELYDETFKTLLKYEKCDPCRHSVVSEFTEDLGIIFAKHSDIVPQMAMGIKESKERSSFSLEEDMQLHYFLDRFYISRIGIRTLIKQHLLIYGPNLNENPTHVGAIDPNCSPLQLTISAYAYGRMLCTRTFGRAPGAVIETVGMVSDNQGGTNVYQPPELSVHVDEHGNPADAHILFAQQPSCADLYIKGRNLTFCYIPGHLFHMLFELTKNAMRAVVEQTTEGSALPKLHFLISHAPEDITIRNILSAFSRTSKCSPYLLHTTGPVCENKISDCGGGMARNLASQAFKYTYTTASNFPSADQLSKSDVSTSDLAGLSDKENGPDPERSTLFPLAGHGHGLPLSRLYARYMGGDLVLMSTEGYGSSAYIYMKRLPEHAFELLPIFNRTSRAVYQSTTMLDSDWVSGTEPRNNQPSSNSCFNAP